MSHLRNKKEGVRLETCQRMITTRGTENRVDLRFQVVPFPPVYFFPVRLDCWKLDFRFLGQRLERNFNLDHFFFSVVSPWPTKQRLSHKIKDLYRTHSFLPKLNGLGD